jgi:tetratricopeptide (TPR) repeat protein
VTVSAPLWVALALSACGSIPESTLPAPLGTAVASGAQGAIGAEVARVDETLPPEAVARFDAAVAQMNAGDTAAAEQALRALAAEYPKFSGPLVNLGILEAKTGRIEAAERTLLAALERKPDNAVAFNQLGVVYRQLGRFQDAERAYREALRVDPEYAKAFLNLGVLCDLYLQQPQCALEAYERYLSLAPEADARVSSWAAEVRKRLGAAAPSRSEG